MRIAKDFEVQAGKPATPFSGDEPNARPRFWNQLPAPKTSASEVPSRDLLAQELTREWIEEQDDL